ncbi:MAG: penicillin acylase family protein [Roseiarcus sp.]
MVVRIVKWALIVVVAVVVLAAGAVAALFYRAMPDYAGAARLPGLTGETRVYRDTYGVPHIFAPTMDDAARALGYLHASERLYQMEILRRAGQGRLAEIAGADLIGVDRFIRTLGFYRLAESSFAALRPETQAYLQAYADGVNAFLATHKDRLPPEFLILGDDPEPWKPADTLVWGKLMSLQLSQNYAIEEDRAQLAQKMSPDLARLLYPAAPAGSPITTLPTGGAVHSEIPSAQDRLGALIGVDHGASNEWVVSGARTQTGKPILANDPHLGIEAPILWYLARIVTPGLSIKGATVPGAPIVLLGQNDHIAWGFTTADTDTQDLFIETVDPKNPDQYLTPDGARPFVVRDEIIRVKNAPDVVLKVRATRHGPVLSDVDKKLAGLAGAGKVVALAFAGLGERDTSVAAIADVDRAQNWDQFLEALKSFQTPTQNLVFADTVGNIGFISPGLAPLRKSGDGLMPVDGASGDYDWTGFIPFDQLPQAYNPPTGFLFNANNANVTDDHVPTFGRDWEENYRARRIQQFFDTIDKHSLDTSAAMQADILSLAATDFLPLIKRIAPADERARQALALIARWSGAMDKDRPEPLIFKAWLSAMRRIMINEKTGLPLSEKGPYAAMTLYSLLNDHPQWCDAPQKPDPDCGKTMGRALDEALALLAQRDGADMSQWRWGKEHVAVLTHKLYSHVPLLDRWSDLSRATSGGFYTLDRGEGFDPKPDRPFARTHAAGFRGLYDLGDPDKSRFMIATGESGHIFSPHYGDLTPLWAEGKAITLAGSEDELKRSGASLMTFTPQ